MSDAYRSMAFVDVIAETMVRAAKAKEPAQPRRSVMDDAKLVFNRLVERNWPYCRECGKQVEHVFIQPESMENAMSVRVYCHGETRAKSISGRALMASAWDKGRFIDLIEEAIAGPWFFSPPPGPEVP